MDIINLWSSKLNVEMNELTQNEIKKIMKQEQLISNTYSTDKQLFSELLDVLESLNDDLQTIKSKHFFNAMDCIINLWDEIETMNRLNDINNS